LIEIYFLHTAEVHVHYFYTNNAMKGMVMKIFAVIKQYQDESPEMSVAYKTMEAAQQHVDDIVAACQGEPCYKYYVQESAVVML